MFYHLKRKWYKSNLNYDFQRDVIHFYKTLLLNHCLQYFGIDIALGTAEIEFFHLERLENTFVKLHNSRTDPTSQAFVQWLTYDLVIAFSSSQTERKGYAHRYAKAKEGNKVSPFRDELKNPKWPDRRRWEDCSRQSESWIRKRERPVCHILLFQTCSRQ